jgi:hypothetical protein
LVDKEDIQQVVVAHKDIHSLNGQEEDTTNNNAEVNATVPIIIIIIIIASGLSFVIKKFAITTIA